MFKNISQHIYQGKISIEIEGRFGNYRPPRNMYELVVFAGGRVLKQQVQAGQGNIRVPLQ